MPINDNCTCAAECVYLPSLWGQLWYAVGVIDRYAVFFSLSSFSTFNYQPDLPIMNPGWQRGMLGRGVMFLMLLTLNTNR